MYIPLPEKRFCLFNMSLVGWGLENKGRNSIFYWGFVSIDVVKKYIA
jgi:hypothetical protein